MLGDDHASSGTPFSSPLAASPIPGNEGFWVSIMPSHCCRCRHRNCSRSERGQPAREAICLVLPADTHRLRVVEVEASATPILSL